jgi:hypothetical protein
VITVPDDGAQRHQVIADVFAEAGFVVHLGDQIAPAHRDHLGAQHLPHRDRPQFSGLRQRGLERSPRVQAQHVAQKRQALRWMRQI